MLKKTTSIIYVLFLCLLTNAALAQQDILFTETFADSIPAGWTIVTPVGDGTPSANWTWTNSGPAGPIGANIGALTSTTSDDGWMIFDSEINCSGGQDAWLISPQLDLTDQDEVFLQFETRYIKFEDQVSLQVSTDSATWEEIILFPDVQNNQFTDINGSTNPDVILVNLTNLAANQGSVWFAFRFLADQSTAAMGSNYIGCAYAWQVDDITVLNYNPTPPLPPVDLAITAPFYLISSYAQPISQIDTDTTAFLAGISNNGANDLNEVWLKAEVIKEGTEVIFSDSVMIDFLPAGASDTLVLNDLFVPNDPTVHEIGEYTIRYTAWSSDGNLDAFPDDNVASRNFEITANLFAKENGGPFALGPPPGISHAHMNVFTTSDNILSQEYIATTCQFAANSDDPIEGLSMTVFLSAVNDELVDANWNGFNTENPPLESPTLILRSANTHLFEGLNGSLQTTELVDSLTGTPGVPLEPSTRYLMGINYRSGLISIGQGYSTTINYPNSISSWAYAGGQWFPGIVTPDGIVSPAPIIRMEISLATTSDETPLTADAMEIFPNPVSDVLNMNVILEESGIANITLADLTGKVIQMYDYSDLRADNFQFDVSNFAAGTYLIRLATENGTVTKRFIVQR